MNRTSEIKKGRKSLREQAWIAAYKALSAADRESPLEPDDLEGLSTAAYLMGKEAEGAEYLSRAHQGFVAQGKTQRAVRCAFWLGFALLLNGEYSQAGGWLSRAGRMLEEEPDCSEKGYLLLPAGFRLAQEGDAVAGHAVFVEATEIAKRFDDRDLLAFALHGQGRALIKQGKIARGVTLLDEAMVAVTSNELSPRVAGGVYCSVIEACSEIFDLRRSQEWTSALDHWCSSQPDKIPYGGHCLIRRAEIQQFHGTWPNALILAQQACERLSQPTPKRAAGSALNVIAEIHRLRGEFDQAETAYRRASQLTNAPQSGFALLQLARGKTDAARNAIVIMEKEKRDPCQRVGILDAYVEIMLATNDIDAARAAASELTGIAGDIPAPMLQAISARATGAVLIAESNPGAAVAPLRQSINIWRELEAPYEGARTEALLAIASRALGDNEGSNQSLIAAKEVFTQLQATTDLARVDRLLGNSKAKSTGTLTAREVEVLKHIASGMSNKSIASRLGISEKTVARHVSNIFTKLDLSSRSAATAYAFQNKLF